MLVTGVEIIVAALAAGATAGATNTASAAVQDAYTSLREALRHRLPGRVDHQQALDAEETESHVLRGRLGQELINSGANHGDEALAAAQRLLALVDPAGARVGKYAVDLAEAKGVQVGDHNTQHNTFS